MKPSEKITIHTGDGEELTFHKAQNQLWCCPACGSPELEQQPYTEQGLASFEICNCFFQIGYDDNPQANKEAVQGIKNNWKRWRRHLISHHSQEANEIEKLKSQLAFIGVELPPLDTLEAGIKEETTDDHYQDPLLTRLYDLQNPWGPDCDFYLSLAGDKEKPHKILDIGCGTGLLTTAFAKAGHDVTGVDPSVEMLNIAIRRPYGDKVMWIKSDAEHFKSDRLFDLVVLTGHAFQVFISDDEVEASLKNIRAHLAPGGRIVFDSRNPNAQAWENWTPEKTKEAFKVPPANKYSEPEEIEVWHDLGAVEDCGEGKVVQYFTLYHKLQTSSKDTSSIVKTTARIRFQSQKELTVNLNIAGLKPIDLYGNWDRSSLTQSSKEIIVVAGEKKPDN